MSSIRVGVVVRVIAGDDKGVVGPVRRVLHLRKTTRVVVGGVALSRRTRRARAGNPGSMHVAERAIDISNVMLIEGGGGIASHPVTDFGKASGEEVELPGDVGEDSGDDVSSDNTDGDGK